MSLLFVLNVVLILLVFYTAYLNMSGKLDKKSIFTIISAISLAYFISMGIIGLFGGAAGNLNCISFFSAGIALIAVSFIVKKFDTRLTRLVFKTLMVYAVLEIVVFNFNSYQLLSIKAPVAEELDISSKNTRSDRNIETSIEFKDINREIGTVKIVAHSQNNKKMVFDIDYSDATSKRYRSGIARAEIINDCEKSYTIPINASGEISNIKFRFRAEKDDVITVDSITVNAPIAFRFSLIRLIAIFLLVMLKYMLCDSKSFSQTLAENESLCIRSARCMTVIFIIIALMLMLAQRNGGLKNIHKDFLANGGNQITQEIVDSFENGQVSMLTEVDPKLEALDNPYDWSQRDGISYPWDHLYYNGKYYSYYGIATVLLLFLPYHFITGHYFPSQWAVFIFGALGIYFLYKLYMEYMKEFFGRTKISLVLMGLAMAQLISGIWFCFPTPNFYEIAQTSGFMFCTGGFYFLARSGVIGSRKISLPCMAVSSVLLALGVLSRPTLALYCICALLFIFAGAMKIGKTGEKKLVPFLCAALLPYVFFGLIQMVYNFARFGSPLDFGIQYSLTINDFVNAQYHPHLAGIGFFNYLFALPSFEDKFPFMTTFVKTFDPNGYYFVANSTAIGLLWMALPLFSYCRSRKAFLLSDNENKRFNSILIFAVCIAAPFIIIANVWESGYAARYKVDFAWQILMGALTIAFIVYNSCKNEGVRKILTKTFFISLALCFIFNFAQIYSFTIGIGGFNHEALDKYMLLFERAFEFWR